MAEPRTAPEQRDPPDPSMGEPAPKGVIHLVCDRCGEIMYEIRCKIMCGNCGNRFDCSDLNLYYD